MRTTLSFALLSGAVWPALAQSQAAHPNSARQLDAPAVSARFPLTRPHPRSVLPLPTREELTTSDAAFDLRTDRSFAFWRTPPEAPSMPSDSIRTAVESRGRAWLATLRAKKLDALHLDDAGRIHVVAGEDSIARHLFAQRLAIPGLSTVDQAYTLHAAAASFADTTHPGRLPIAESYAAALDRLADREARVYAFRAHSVLAGAYDGLGQRESALRHALRALTGLSQLPLADREEAYIDPALYMIAAHALQHESNGRQRLDTLMAMFQAAAVLSPGMTAADTVARGKKGLSWPDSAERITSSAGLLGRLAPPIYAHAMWNSSAPQATKGQPFSVPLNDGVVRLVLFGNVYCCVDDLIALERLHAGLPTGASALLVTATSGYINGVLVPPEDEIAELRPILLDTLHLKYPIAVWASAKQGTASEGMVPSPSPNLAPYFVSRGRYGRLGSAAYVAIIDGHGIVRHIFSASRGFTRDDQQRALLLIRELVTKKE